MLKYIMELENFCPNCINLITKTDVFKNRPYEGVVVCSDCGMEYCIVQYSDDHFKLRVETILGVTLVNLIINGIHTDPDGEITS